MKDIPGGSYLVMYSTPIFLRDMPPVYIWYNFNHWEFLGFIYNEEAGSNFPGDSHLSRYPDNFFNVFIFPVFCCCILYRYFDACYIMVHHK